MDGRAAWRGDREQIADTISKWASAGASHISVNTMGAGLRTVDDHLAVLEGIAADISSLNR